MYQKSYILTSKNFWVLSRYKWVHLVCLWFFATVLVVFMGSYVLCLVGRTRRFKISSNTKLRHDINGDFSSNLLYTSLNLYVSTSTVYVTILTARFSKNEVDRCINSIMHNFKIIAQDCIYSIAYLNISYCVEHTFFDGKMGIFLI